MMDDDAVNRNVKISVFNVKTGELKGERLYKWTDTENKDGAFTFGGVNGTAFLDGNDFYIFQGKKLVKYDFGITQRKVSQFKPGLLWQRKIIL